ncbi:TPA: hypothetical protein ACS8BP_003240 [Providencia alcalifaciens]|nr:Rpn family recombination-promoting nuclease/putative transposase [Providencia alcalifaciens]
MTQVDSAKDFFDIHVRLSMLKRCVISVRWLSRIPRLSDVLYSVQTTQGEGYIY